MAKRIVVESDLSKQECPEEDMVKLSLTRKGKKGRVYEISSSDAEKLEQQLVSGKQLGLDWFFAGIHTYIPPQESSSSPEIDSGDEDFVIRKKQEQKEPRPQPEVVKASSEQDCTHMNKTATKMTIRDGESYAYTNCKECGLEVPVHKLDERKNYTNSTPPKGSRIGRNTTKEE